MSKFSGSALQAPRGTLDCAYLSKAIGGDKTAFTVMRERNYTLLQFIWFLFLPLFPIFFLQALHTKRKARKLPDASPPHSGVFGSKKVSFQLVGFGDSVIAGTGLSRAEQSLTAKIGQEVQKKTGQSVKWISKGTNGDKLRDLLARVDDISSAGNKLIVVSVGVNDVTRLTSIREWRRNLGVLVNILRSRCDRLVFVGLPSMETFPLLPFPLCWFLGLRASMLNFWLERETEIFSDVFHFDYQGNPTPSDMAADGYHPSESACENFAKIIVDFLELD
tara:strand:- start:937 stop:1767 length:831 start_codon:yes stop_codon:yes gene_type:complete